MKHFLYTVFAFFTVLPFAAPVSAQQPVQKARSESVVHIDGQTYWVHSVGQGETLFSISRLYGVRIEDILNENPLAREGLRAGEVLKIPQPEQPSVTPRRQARLFDEHTVRQGETAYSIARGYGISLNVLVEDNPGLDPTLLSPGQTLLIRKKEVGETTPAEVAQQWEDYRDAANTVSDEYVYHLVKPGETLYSLSRMFGVPQQTIVELNGLDDGLKANGIIRIPAPDVEQADGRTGPDFSDKAVPPSMYTPGDSDVAILLPFETGAADFMDFYRGSLLAFDDLKSEGRSMRVTVYDTGRSEQKVREIVASPGFSDIDLIIGPVYEASILPALEYADAYGIPIVSPLAAVGTLDSNMLYQMAPDASSKYDKLRPLFQSNSNVVLISSSTGNDGEFEREIASVIGAGNYGRFTIGGQGNIASLIDWDRENIFVVLAADELGVDKALASISTAYNNASARRSRTALIRVVGSSRWAGFGSNSIDKNLFFKLNVCFATSYYVNRFDGRVADFEARYLDAYGDLPSRAACRGYDAVRIFGEALHSPGLSFADKLGTGERAPLQVPYRFIREAGSRTHVNDQWALVCFRDDYTIAIQ